MRRRGLPLLQWWAALLCMMADTDIIGFSFLNMFKYSTRPVSRCRCWPEHGERRRLAGARSLPDRRQYNIWIDGKYNIITTTTRARTSALYAGAVLRLFPGPPRTTHWSREPADARRYNYTAMHLCPPSDTVLAREAQRQSISGNSGDGNSNRTASGLATNNT